MAAEGVGRRRGAGLWRIAAAAVIGLSRRTEAAPVRAPWRDRSASSYEAPLAADDPLQLGRAAQLPPFGRGNGIEALFWTPLARLAGDRVDAALAALAEDDIAAWAAAVRGPTGAGADHPHDLWVGSLRLDDAQDVVMRVLAEA
jgi:hypothetical protein